MVTAHYLTDTVPVAAVKAIAGHVRAAVRTRYDADSCIASTAVFLDVTAWLGLDASPAPVEVLAANPGGLREMAAATPRPVEQWPEDAWTVGIVAGQEPRAGGWPGHLVAVLHGQRERLVDVSADQMDRPQRGLRVPSPVLGRLPDGWGASTPCVTHLHEHGTMLRWTPTEDTSWRDSPNWDPRGLREQQESRAVTLEEAKRRLTLSGITPEVFTAPSEVS